MSSDVFVIRNGDGAEVGPCSAQTISVLISEGVITADACVVSDRGLLPISKIPSFAKALSRIDVGPVVPLDKVLFTSDLEDADGAVPLGSDDLEDPVQTSDTLSLDLPGTESDTSTDLFGPEHTAVDPWFAGVLVELWRRGQTGVLEVKASDIVTTIYLLDGTPMFESNGTLADTLGRLLIRMGRITEDQLEKAIEHYMERYEGTNKRVGEVLIELGFVTPDQISEALHIQTREKILSCFQWTELEYQLEKDDEVVKRMPRFACPVPALLEDGIRRFYDPTRLEHVRQGLLSEHPHLRPDQVAGALAGRPDDDDLELELPDGDEEEAMADAFDVPPKERSSSATRAMWAEHSFKAGKRLLLERPMAAVAKLRRAVKLRPEMLEYQALLAYVEYQTARNSDERTERARAAREFAEQALAQDRKVSTAHTILGHFAKLSGDLSSALEHFRHALELDPSDSEARYEFRILRPSEPIIDADADRA